MGIFKAKPSPELKSYQMGALGIVVSTVIAGAMVLLLRKTAFAPSEYWSPGDSETGAPAATPHHFSETLVVPGFTETGEEIAEQDAVFGQAPEGV